MIKISAESLLLLSTSFTSTFFIKIFFLLPFKMEEWEKKLCLLKCSRLLQWMSYIILSMREEAASVRKRHVLAQTHKKVWKPFFIYGWSEKHTRVNWGLMNVFFSSHENCIRRRVYSFLILFVYRKLSFYPSRKVSSRCHHLSFFGNFFRIYFA